MNVQAPADASPVSNTAHAGAADLIGAGAQASPAQKQASAALEPRRVLLRSAKRYGIAALACLAFSLIYAQFSHGVYSPFMSFMFLIPLLGGCVPSLALAAASATSASATPVTSSKVRAPWALAIATFTVASTLRGIFEIAGTASPLLVVYVGVGASLAVFVAVAALVLQRKR